MNQATALQDSNTGDDPLKLEYDDLDAFLPHLDYNAMSKAHGVLTLKMMEATNAHLHSGYWPQHVQEEQRNALHMIADAMRVYEAFLSRYGMIASDYHQDFLDSPEGQVNMLEHLAAEEWAEKVFKSLPELPNQIG